MPSALAQFRTAQWATEGSLKVLRMVVDPSTYAYDAQYDVIKDGVLDRKDQMELLRMATGLSPLPAYAKGGLASGWSLVGEEGPEIVNFSNPGRVYSSSQTKAALSSDNNDAVIAKLSEQIAKQDQMIKHLAAAVKVLSAGFQRTIELSENKATIMNGIEHKIRLAALQR